MTTGDERKDAIGYAFTAPYILFLLVFTAYPLVFSFYLVFHSWDLITPPEYVGLKNFYFLMHDTDFWQALLNTLIFLAIHIPAQVVFSIMIAMALAEKIVAKTFFRAAFHLREIGPGHGTRFHQRLTGKQLDLQPDLKLVFIRPDSTHLRARIT